MKLPTFLFLFGLTATVFAEANPRFRDAATHEQLVLRLGRAAGADPMAKLPVATGEDPSVRKAPEDLIKQSDILCFNGVATLVPKRALLGVPEAFRDRVGLAAGVRIVGWTDFLAANRAWITTEEVSLAQASGREAMAEATLDRIGRSGNLTVATYLGGPISVLAPAAEPSSTESSK